MSTETYSSAEDPRISSLLRDTTSAIEELSGLAARLGDLGRSQPADANGQDQVAALQAEFEALKARLGGLTRDGRRTLAHLDQQVKTNPYLFIIGALGLGMLLGKARRP